MSLSDGQGKQVFYGIGQPADYTAAGHSRPLLSVMCTAAGHSRIPPLYHGEMGKARTGKETAPGSSEFSILSSP